MNLVTFLEEEWGQPLDGGDRRAVHVREVLKLAPGDTLRVACIGRGSGTAVLLSADGPLVLNFPERLSPVEPPLPLGIILGHVRPLVMQRLFKDLASLGLAYIYVVNAGLTEASYFKASFWTKNEYMAHLIEGTMQGGLARLPEVRRFWTLSEAIQACDQGLRIAAHIGPYPSLKHLVVDADPETMVTIAIGPERGWTVAEVEDCVQGGFTLASLGPRILRTELAASSLAVLRALP